MRSPARVPVTIETVTCDDERTDITPRLAAAPLSEFEKAGILYIHPQAYVHETQAAPLPPEPLSHWHWSHFITGGSAGRQRDRRHLWAACYSFMIPWHVHCCAKKQSLSRLSRFNPPFRRKESQLREGKCFSTSARWLALSDKQITKRPGFRPTLIINASRRVLKVLAIITEACQLRENKRESINVCEARREKSLLSSRRSYRSWQTWIDIQNRGSCCGGWKWSEKALSECFIGRLYGTQTTRLRSNSVPSTKFLVKIWARALLMTTLAYKLNQNWRKSQACTKQRVCTRDLTANVNLNTHFSDDSRQRDSQRMNLLNVGDLENVWLLESSRCDKQTRDSCGGHLGSTYADFK